jgi:hypothetical protein
VLFYIASTTKKEYEDFLSDILVLESSVDLWLIKASKSLLTQFIILHQTDDIEGMQLGDMLMAYSPE